MDNLQL